MTIETIETIDITPAAATAPKKTASLLGASSLLIRRRMWRDKIFILASVIIVAIATLLALAGPRVVLNTIDGGARDAVDSAGSSANIVVTFPVGNLASDNVTTVRGADPAAFDNLAANAYENLPGVIASLVTGYTTTVKSHQAAVSEYLPPVGPDADLSNPDSLNASLHPELWSGRLGSYLHFAISDDVEWNLVAGALPRDATGLANPGALTETIGGTEITRLETTTEVIEIALTPSVADTLGFSVGTIFRVASPGASDLTMRVVGIVTPADPSDELWTTYPEATTGIRVDNPAQPLFLRGTVIVSTATATAISNALGDPFEGTIIMDMGSEGLTLQGVHDVGEAMDDLKSHPSSLLPSANVSVNLRSGLGEALDVYPARARAALAQMSVMIAGVIGVAAVIIALMARLLLSRRANDIALERARGATVASIALRLGIESLLFTIAGVVVGSLAATALVGGVAASNSSVALVSTVSVLASPVLGALVARRTWTGRRVAANRQDRSKLAKVRMARRITLEVLAIVIAIAAVVTLRGRGIQQSQTEGIDPFLAASPLLLALGITVVVLRIYPAPMRLIQEAARRTRGVAGVITLAKARAKLPVLPLLAMTLSIGIAVSGGLLIATVAEGQQQASWERVGGDVRVNAMLDPAAVTELKAEGLIVSELVIQTKASMSIGSAFSDATLIVADGSYADVVAAAGITNPSDLRRLEEASAVGTESGAIPALVSSSINAQDYGDKTSIYVGDAWVEFEIIGVLRSSPSGWLGGPYVVLPADALASAELEEQPLPTMAIIAGPGAAETVAASSIPELDMLTREAWLASVRDSALIGGVERMMALTVVAVGFLAALGLLITVLQGVRERGLTLSMLRTQGMSNGYGWWLALTELAPLTIAAVLGGAVAGLAILGLLGDTLGLQVLAGGIAAPKLVADPVFLGSVGVGIVVLLLAAVSAEVATHRRNKLSEVLRLGETR